MDIFIINFFIGVLLGISPCVLPLIPVYSQLISSAYHKYSVLMFFVLYIILVYAFLGALLSYIDILSVLQPLLPTIFILAGLIYLEVLVVMPYYSNTKNIYVSLLLLPFLAASCTLPAFVLALGFSYDSFLALLGLGIGFNLPIILAVIFGPYVVYYIPLSIVNILKIFIGACLLFIGFTYSYINTEMVSQRETYFFTADWCTYCNKLKKSVDFSKYDVIIVDITTIEPEERNLMKQFDIISVPTIIVVEKGKIIKKVEGYSPENVKKALKI